MYAAGPNEFRDFAKEYEIEKQNEIEMKVRSNFFKLNSTDIDDLAWLSCTAEFCGSTIVKLYRLLKGKHWQGRRNIDNSGGRKFMYIFLLCPCN